MALAVPPPWATVIRVVNSQSCSDCNKGRASSCRSGVRAATSRSLPRASISYRAAIRFKHPPQIGGLTNDLQIESNHFTTGATPAPKVALTATGTREGVDVPLPSWPESFRPQHSTRSSLLRAQL